MGSFFFNDTATTEIYTLSLHDALPIFGRLQERQLLMEALARIQRSISHRAPLNDTLDAIVAAARELRSEEHTSELQSRQYLVCRLLLEKNIRNDYIPAHL